MSATSNLESTLLDPSPKDEDLDHLKQRQERLFDQLEQLAAKLKQIKDSLHAPNFPAQMTGKPNTHEPVAERLSKNAQVLKTSQMNDSTLDVVVTMSPRHKPVALMIIYTWLQKAGLDVSLAEHIHSSVRMSRECLYHNRYLALQLKPESQRSGRQLILTIIWKEVSNDLELKVSPMSQGIIVGETNMLRYLSSAFLSSLTFKDDPIKATLVDHWLDLAHLSVALGNENELQAVLLELNRRLSTNEYLVGHGPSIADIGMLSALFQASSSTAKFPSSVKKWMQLLCKDENVARVLKAMSYNIV